MSNLDIRVSTLDICMSKVILEFGKNKHTYVQPGHTYVQPEHCYKYKLTKSGSGGFLATQLQEQDLNSAIEYLQEQELIKN